MQYNDETFWKHEYNLTDHLGNVRVVFAAHSNGQPELMQQTSYYPFGMTLQQQNFGGEFTQPNKLLYNGKELQDDELAGVSLDWYDFHARFYDPAIVRTTTQDPMAESFYNESPYSFMGNNPINFTDPTGMIAEPIYDEAGNHLGNTKEGFTGQVLIYSGNKDVDFSEMSADEAMAMDEIDTYDNQRSGLAGDAKSNIWTHVASQLEGEQIYDETFSMGDLTGGKIHYDGKASGSWVSSYVIGKGKGKITGSDKYNYETTVENIQSSIGVHEYYSHIKKNQGGRYSSHRLAYKNVINYKSLWNNTTDKYKGFNMQRLRDYTESETGRKTVDPLYRNLFNKYSRYSR